MEDLLKNAEVREEELPRVNLKHTKRDTKVANKVSELFKSWDELVKIKAKDHTKMISVPKKYQEARASVFGNELPKPRRYNKFEANMEAFNGQILEKYDLLSNKKKKRVLRVKHPIKLIAKLTNLKFLEIFPKEADQDAFEEILLTSSFSKDEVIKR